MHTVARQRRLITLLALTALALLAIGAAPTSAGDISDDDIGHITGRVTSDATGLPLAGMSVTLSWIPGGGGIWFVDHDATDANGNYDLTLFVNAGTYVVNFYDPADNPIYRGEWWNDAALSANATPVPVEGGQTTPNINAGLAFDRQPDVRVKRGATGTYAGNDVYNTTGQNQTRTASIARGASVTYYVSVQNDGHVAERFRLKGTTGNTRFNVRYTVGAVNVTPQMKAGTYLTPSLSPGGTHLVKVTVTALAASTRSSSLTVGLLSKSNTEAAQRDLVRMVTNRS